MRAGGRTLTIDPGSDIPGCPYGFTSGEAGERLQTAIDLANGAHLVIDAMTGIGSHGALRGIAGTIASSIGLCANEDGIVLPPDRPAMPNRESVGEPPLVLAVDTPSGIGVDDGTLPGPVIAADATVMFGAMKPCAMLPPATFACGRITLVDFDFDLTGSTPVAMAVDGDYAADILRLPHAEDGKYDRGVVGLITGSERYPGAAVLSSMAAARTNTGMIRYLGPSRAQDMVLARLPEAVIGKGHVQSWVVGCGVPDARSDASGTDVQRTTIGRLLAHYAVDADDETGEEHDGAHDMPPIVVDAGALDLLPDHVPPQVVLTPHAGELARMVNRLNDASDGEDHAVPADWSSGNPIDAQDVSADPLRYARLGAE